MTRRSMTHIRTGRFRYRSQPQVNRPKRRLFGASVVRGLGQSVAWDQPRHRTSKGDGRPKRPMIRSQVRRLQPGRSITVRGDRRNDQDRITTCSPGNGAPAVGRYNAEGNRPTAGAELIRCNAKVIRPHDQASNDSVDRSGQTSSTSVTPAATAGGSSWSIPTSAVGIEDCQGCQDRS